MVADTEQWALTQLGLYIKRIVNFVIYRNDFISISLEYTRLSNACIKLSGPMPILKGLRIDWTDLFDPKCLNLD